MELYQNTNSYYYESSRDDLISFIPVNSGNILLEVGAGTGNTLIRIKDLGLAREIVGVDLFEIPGSKQKDKAIDHFITGNIETISLPFPENYFDVIICGDVLEHLTDPWKVVKKLSGYLKPGGRIIASIPNIREISTLMKILIKGDFKYEKDGILDQTHIRFFCKKNMKALFSSEIFDLVSITPNFDRSSTRSKRRFVNHITCRIFEEFLAIQFILVAVKK